MKISSSGIQLVRRFEGCRLEAYQDQIGIWTLGWGNTFFLSGEKVKIGDKITQDQADKLNEITLERFASKVDSLVKVHITQNQFDALVSFAYNVGLAQDGFAGSTLLKKVNKNPNDPSITQEFEKWVKAGGKTLDGLVKRRAAEAKYYFK
jgi:lysozyme